jgi:hypothetical protein
LAYPIAEIASQPRYAMPNKQIARVLQISSETVESHMKRIFLKLPAAHAPKRYLTPSRKVYYDPGMPLARRWRNEMLESISDRARFVPPRTFRGASLDPGRRKFGLEQR